jgi:RND family efflux transporter MFP subunit
MLKFSGLRSRAMNRRRVIAAVLLAIAGWMILPVPRTAAFQEPSRGGRPRPAAAGAQRGGAAAAAQPAPRAATPANPSGERTISAVPNRSRIVLIHQRTLASDVPGIIETVPFREGDEVQEGDVVAGLRDDVAAAALATATRVAESDIEQQYAVAAHEVADITVKAALGANERFGGAVPAIEIEKLRLDANRARLQIDKSQHDQEVARLKAEEAEAALKAYTIAAPQGGVVTRVLKFPGEAVRQGDPILEMVSTQRVRVEGEIDVRGSWQVRRGNAVAVQIDLPDAPAEIKDRTFEGLLVYVDPTVDAISLTVRVWAEVDNPEGLLKPGLRATMTIYPDRMVEEPRTVATGG